MPTSRCTTNASASNANRCECSSSAASSRARGTRHAGFYCFHACRAMVKLGHEVRVVSPRGWLEGSGSAKSLPGLPEMRVEYPLYVYPPRILQSVYDRFMEASSRRAMTRTMSELDPDCILSYWVHPDGAVAARVARRAGIPSAVIVGGSDVLVLAARAGRRRRSVVRALQATDAVITVGRHLAGTVEALGIPAEQGPRRLPGRRPRRCSHRAPRPRHAGGSAFRKRARSSSPSEA